MRSNPLMGHEDIRQVKFEIMYQEYGHYTEYFRYPTICEADRVRLRKRIADHDAKEAEEKQKTKKDKQIMAKAKEMREQVDQDRMDMTSANNGPSRKELVIDLTSDISK